MISTQDILDNFSDVEDVGNGVSKFRDIVPALTFCYYFTGSLGSQRNLLTVTDGFENDQFAEVVLRAAQNANFETDGLDKQQLLASNEYQMTHLLFAPCQFHDYFKGRLDQQRKELYLVLPIHDCEFSGNESLELFREIRKNINSGLNWRRDKAPKVLIRFENPKTGGGASDGVPVGLPLLDREIDNLNGVPSGFIEVTNFQGYFAEILSPENGRYLFRTQFDDEARPVSRETVVGEVLKFVTSGVLG